VFCSSCQVAPRLLPGNEFLLKRVIDPSEAAASSTQPGGCRETKLIVRRQQNVVVRHQPSDLTTSFDPVTGCPESATGRQKQPLPVKESNPGNGNQNESTNGH
jgi:hypothetical protein